MREQKTQCPQAPAPSPPDVPGDVRCAGSLVLSRQPHWPWLPSGTPSPPTALQAAGPRTQPSLSSQLVSSGTDSCFLLQPLPPTIPPLPLPSGEVEGLPRASGACAEPDGESRRMLRSYTLFLDRKTEAQRGRVGAARASEPRFPSPRNVLCVCALFSPPPPCSAVPGTGGEGAGAGAVPSPSTTCPGVSLRGGGC